MVVSLRASISKLIEIWQKYMLLNTTYSGLVIAVQ